MRHVVSGRRAIALAAVVVAAAATGSVLAASGALSSGNPWPYATTTSSPVLAVVGDVSCQPGPKLESEKSSDVCSGDSTRNAAQAATANQIEADHPSLVAILGDEQYQVGRYEDFMGSYDKTYGAFKFLQRPSPGNHEFYMSHGETGDNGVGYFDYFNGFRLNADGSPLTDTYPITTPGNAGSFTQPRPRDDGQAGEVGEGWYSYNLGDWHIISLNAECETQAGGCDPNGAWLQSETQWLTRDLDADNAQCTIAYWHQPTFSPTEAPTVSADGQAADTWWKLLYQHGADLILNGHDHVYARYAPRDPSPWWLGLRPATRDLRPRTAPRQRRRALFAHSCATTAKAESRLPIGSGRPPRASSGSPRRHRALASEHAPTTARRSLGTFAGAFARTSGCGSSSSARAMTRRGES